MTEGPRILVGVSGSIAAYKMAEVVRALVKSGADVRVVMTEAATRFVAPATFAALSEHAVHADVFDEPERVVHVELGRWADCFVVGAASAATLSRLASGQASDMLSATYLMARCPVLVAPAMHTEMWDHPATKRSVAALVEDGCVLVHPEAGPLASGDVGMGRLASPETIVEAVWTAIARKDLAGLRVLVTAGPTREPLDPVRYISNRSSGRMGFALAAAARRRGADVVVVAGPTTAPPPSDVEIVRVETAQQMLDECLARFGDVDVVVKAAAVSDWRPASVASDKAKKEDGAPQVALEATPDIAAELGRKKGSQFLVLFAAETTDVERHGRDKLERKGADLVVANLVGRPGTGFDSETNEAYLVSSAGSQRLERMGKDDLAERIWDAVGSLRGADPSAAR